MSFGKSRESVLGSIDLLDSILLFKAFYKGANHHVHSWHDTTTSCDDDLGRSRFAVDRGRGSRAQELQTRLQIAHLRIELFLQAESTRLREKCRCDRALFSCGSARSLVNWRLKWNQPREQIFEMVDLCKANLCVVQEVCGRVVLILLYFEAGLNHLTQALLLFQAWPCVFDRADFLFCKAFISSLILCKSHLLALRVRSRGLRS